MSKPLVKLNVIKLPRTRRDAINQLIEAKHQLYGYDHQTRKSLNARVREVTTLVKEYEVSLAKLSLQVKGLERDLAALHEENERLRSQINTTPAKPA